MVISKYNLFNNPTPENLKIMQLIDDLVKNLLIDNSIKKNDEVQSNLGCYLYLFKKESYEIYLDNFKTAIRNLFKQTVNISHISKYPYLEYLRYCLEENVFFFTQRKLYNDKRDLNKDIAQLILRELDKSKLFWNKQRATEIFTDQKNHNLDPKKLGSNEEEINLNKNLIEYCHHSNLDMIKQSLYNKANIHIFDDLPLWMAILRGNLKMVELLIEHGANFDNYHYECIRTSATLKNYDVLEYLLSITQNINTHFIINDPSIDSEAKKYVLQFVEKKKLNDKLQNNLNIKNFNVIKKI